MGLGSVFTLQWMTQPTSGNRTTVEADPSPYMSIKQASQFNFFHCWQPLIPNARYDRSCGFAPNSTSILCSIGIHVSCRNMWNDLITACQVFWKLKHSSVCYCQNIEIISYFLSNPIVLQEFFQSSLFTLISRCFLWNDRNSHRNICEESHFFSTINNNSVCDKPESRPSTP